MKEMAAKQLAEEYDFTPSGDPEMDIMAAMGLRDMEERGEIEPSTRAGGSKQIRDANPKSKRQQKLERQREEARAHNVRGLTLGKR